MNNEALHSKIKLRQRVTWLGRKVGSCVNDRHFTVGMPYEVCFIYPSNGDVELQGNSPELTIRATESEYGR